MTDDADSYRTVSAPALMRWTAAAAVAAAVHAGLAWLILNWQPAAASPSEPPPAVMIELSPLAVAAEAALQEVAPGPQMVEQQAEPTPDEPEEPQEEPEAPPPDPVVKEVKEPVEEPPPPTPPPPPEPDPPKLPEKEEAEAVLPPPPPPQKKAVKKPPPQNAKKSERVKQAPKRTRAPQTTAPPQSRARRADRTAAPFSGAAPSASRSPATWRSAMLAHLNRHKRFPRGAAGSGTAMVAFTITRSGVVTGSRLIRSSGNSAFDAEAVALPRRASPMPPPPPEVRGGSITLTVPVRFTR